MRYLFILGLFWSCFAHGADIAVPDVSSGNQTSFLVLSDIHLNSRSAHVMDFAPKTRKITNDLDVVTYEELMDKLSTSIQSGEIAEPEFVIVLGDIAGHIRSSKETVIENERIVFKKLKEIFPNTPVFYNFGNNDSLSTDYGPFLSHISKSQIISPLHIIKEVWDHGNFLSTGKACKYHQTYPCVIKSNTENGYYSAYLKPKLRLIALNSVMFSKHAKEYKSALIAEQLNWFEQQLNDVESLNETVLITMHIPPGKNTYQPYFWSDSAFWSQEPEQRFYQLVMNHHAAIIGILAGHTHKDEIKLFEDNGKQALSGVYINPALSTSHGNAPALRSYILHQTDELHWNLSDYQTFYFTREAAVGDCTLHSLYRFKDTYCAKKTTNRINDCLDGVSIQKVQENLGAGNKSFREENTEPGNIYIKH